MADVLKKGDTAPEFVEQLTHEQDEDETGPIDLSESDSVRFYLEYAPQDDKKSGAGDLIVNAPMAVDYPTATVTYDFEQGDTSREGRHWAEVVVTYADGEVRTFPDDGYFEVQISEPTNRDVPPSEVDWPNVTVGVVDAEQVSADVGQFGEASVASAPQADADVVRGIDLDDHAARAQEPTVHGNAKHDVNYVSGQGFADHATDDDAHHPRYSPEEVRDTVAGFLAAAGSVGLDVDDAGNTLTISADTDTQLSGEQVRTAVAGFVAGGTNITVGYNDADNSLTINSLSDSEIADALSGQAVGDNDPLASINTEQATVSKSGQGLLHTNPDGTGPGFIPQFSETLDRSGDFLFNPDTSLWEIADDGVATRPWVESNTRADDYNSHDGFAQTFAYLTSDFALAATNSLQTIPLGATRYDQRGDWSDADNTITADDPGLYLISYSIQYEQGVDGDESFTRLVKNGAEIERQRDTIGQTGFKHHTGVLPVQLSAGDSMAMKARSQEGNAVVSGGQAYTYLSYARLI